MAMAHAMLGLEHGHHLHMLFAADGLEQIQPVGDGLPIFFSMAGKYDAGPFIFDSSLMRQTPFFVQAPVVA